MRIVHPLLNSRNQMCWVYVGHNWCVQCHSSIPPLMYSSERGCIKIPAVVSTSRTGHINAHIYWDVQIEVKGRESVRKEQEVVVDHVEWRQLGLRRDQKRLVKAWLDRRVRDGTTEGSNEREMDVRNKIISEETCLLCTDNLTPTWCCLLLWLYL